MLKLPQYPRQYTDSVTLPKMAPQGIFHTTRKNNSKIHIWKHGRPLTAKIILRKKNKTESTMLLGFQTILQSYSNQNSMIMAQKQTLDQWNRYRAQK